MEVCAREGNAITPEIKERIDGAMKEYDEGKFIRCSNKLELQKLLDSL